MKRDPQSSDAAIDARAAEWVARCDAGLSDIEAAQLAAWRSADPRHDAAFIRFTRVWDQADRPRRAGGAAEIRERLAQRARARRRRWVGASGIVVLVGLAAVLGPRLVPGDGATPVRVEAAMARTTLLLPERRELPDGSIAEHPAGAELEIEFTANERRIHFVRGEVHFNVVSDPTRPFVVVAGGVGIRAVGTQFVVRVAETETSVLVTEGKVAVDARANGEPGDLVAYVSAGEAIALKGSDESTVPQVLSVSPSESERQLAWRRKRAEFSAAPLAEVIATVNRYNRIQFVIDDAELAEEPLSGVFFLDDAEAFALLLEQGFGVAVERSAQDRYLLRRHR